MSKKLSIILVVVSLIGLGTYLFTNTNFLKGSLSEGGIGGDEPATTEGSNSDGSSDIWGGGDSGSPAGPDDSTGPDKFDGGGITPPTRGGTETPTDDGDGTVFILVTDPYDNEITDLSEDDFTVSGGSDNSIIDFEDQGGGEYKLTLYTNDTYSITVESDGYVSETLSGIEPNTDLDDVIEVYSAVLEYGYVVKVVEYGEDGNDVSDFTVSPTVTAGDLSIECTGIHNSEVRLYGCLVPLSETEYSYKITLTGYETMEGEFSSDRTSNSAASQTVTETLVIPAEALAEIGMTDVDISVVDSFGNGIEGLELSNFSAVDDGDGDGSLGDEFSDLGNGDYSIELKVTNSSDYIVYVEEDGYVTSSTEVSENITAATYTILLSYAYYIEPINEDGEAVEGADVAIGDIECSEDSDGGDYGCIVPVSTTDLTLTVQAEGYEAYEEDLDESRSSNSDDKIDVQVELTTSEEDEVRLDVDEDSDGDGLTDSEEETYETDPDDADTDDDGLNDYDEVMVYETDPNSADTDEGGVPDYDEVENGTDPNDASDDAEEEVVEEEEDEEEEEVVEEEEEEEEQLECSDAFTDTVGHWAEDAICLLYENGIVEGRLENLYFPNSNITRAEFLKMSLLSNNFDVDYDLDVNTYSDVNPGDWYYYYVALAESMKDLWFSGNGTWSPNSDITRGDAILLLVRLANKTLYGYDASDLKFTDVSVSSYQAYAIILGIQYDVIEGYANGEFRPNNNITRAEAATMIIRSANLFE